MVTYEDITELFERAAAEVGLSAHPDYLLNIRTLEREFACTLHAGPCEDAEHHAACTVSFAWGPLDTVLSMEGAEGICDFFHEPDEACAHLQTDEVPPLGLDLSYTLPLRNLPLNDASLRNLQATMRALKLNVAEHSSRAVETQPNIALVSGESGLQAEALTLQQRVELPLWDPDGPSGYRSAGDRRNGHATFGRGHRHEYGSHDEPHPEEWLPHLMTEVANDIARVLEALDAVRVAGRTGTAADGSAEN
ncbi:MAG TPA: hypothetical protein VF818_04800 [Ktedonobacterales bacterium]